MDILLGPLILATDLILLLRGEIILDVKGLADFFGRFTLDHVGNGLATDVEECFNVEIVGGLAQWLAVKDKALGLL